ncbi:MAG: class I SAM-dependent methyltransferase [Planctomycetes bacterium]|nr:class I SAM-dependent methyltransferase [Planctomycetota bacterium]MBL7042568.1 class I SAM-dependent methyltransferase [Pirellulaceae bacterium]
MKRIAGILLILAAILFMVVITLHSKGDPQNINLWHLLFFLVPLLAGIYLIEPESAIGLSKILQKWIPGLPKTEAQQEKGENASLSAEDTEVQRLVEEEGEILGVNEPPPSPDEWYTKLRPVLHEASYYTVPTYYLDPSLRVIDWNIAFELVFSRIVGQLRYRHVAWFIARLDNRDEVFEHARDFTERVHQGELPLADVEPLRYESEKYGTVSFVKVATQLHDGEGRLHGWAVALFIDKIDWGTFERHLLRALREDKLWSVYAASYDRVLLQFPPYLQLIRDVISVVPGEARLVADLGAGTGNVTWELLDRRHRVTAIENNPMMLDRLRVKVGDSENVTVMKASVEHLDRVSDEKFDAAVMVNVLYAVEDPLRCLRGIHRILKPNGVLAFSTTHSDTRLDPLLESIRSKLEEDGKLDEFARDYENVRAANKEIEKTIAGRRSRDDYRDYVRSAGFEIIRDEASTYVDAVMMIHARKKPDASSSTSISFSEQELDPIATTIQE